jgi:hypothetical protein
MNSKRSPLNRIRGWLPKDLASSLNFETVKIEKPTINEAQRKIFKRIRIFNLSMICAFSAAYFLINPAVKNGEVVLACWIALFASLIEVNTILLDKLSRTAETAKI